MSKLPLSPWNHLCWKDEEMSFDLSALLKIYNEIFSKYVIHSQNQYYCGIGFQGKTSTDTKSAPTEGPLIGDDSYKKLPPKDQYPAIAENIEKIYQRHETLCVGEYARILDYLESKGWYTFRARVMTLLPNNPMNWHADGYDISMRYHVPIITNDQFYLQWRDINGVHYFHLPANGNGYFVRTDVSHQYINRGTEPRTHIIIDIKKK